MLRRLTVALLVGSLCACSNTAPPVATSPITTRAPSDVVPASPSSSNLLVSPAGYAGIGWQATAASLGDRVGQRFKYQCPPDGVNWFTYGTGVYTSDSSVCTAAVHIGLITLEGGGDVTIEIRPGQDAYIGSDRNGIHSAEYGRWEASYVFVDSTGVAIVPGTQPPPTSPATAAPSATASQEPGQNPALDADLLEPGKLTICMPFDRVRFAERDARGEPFGVDVEIGMALAQELVLDPEIVEIAFDDLIGAIQSDQCDVTIGGQFITAARLELIDMVPYREGTQHIVVVAGNPLGIHELTDICGRTVAIVEGTIHVEILAGISDDCTEAGQQAVVVAQYPTEADAERALGSGAADAYIGNDFITVEKPNEFERSAELPKMRNGIGHRLGTAALDEAIRSGLRTIIGNGKYDEILEKYDVTQVRLTELP